MRVSIPKVYSQSARLCRVFVAGVEAAAARASVMRYFETGVVG
jgi:hypothetical protein